jgi:hypothetical protein
VNDVLPTQDVIDHLADRIERAYALRRAQWWRTCSHRGVWTAAALRLWQAHVENPELPLDSELFVASQPISSALSDPWSELTQPEAARRYRSQIQRIIRRLRAELKREVELAEQTIREDREIRATVLVKNSRLSPLGCYIAAHRSGRADLAGRFAAAAVEQHRSCPLYQQASAALLPVELYPITNVCAEQPTDLKIRASKKLAVLN